MNTTDPRRTSDAPTAPSFLTTVRDGIRARRADRAARRQLENELSTYRTAAEIDDLRAMLDRYDEAEVAPIREILDRQRSAA